MDGRSVSRVNGENVTQKQLRSIASVLLDVYGQRDAQILLDSGGQGTLLDDFGADVIKLAKAETAKAYRDLQTTRKQISEIGEDRDRRQREIDLLAYEIQEIEQAQLRSGEDEELENADIPTVTEAEYMVNLIDCDMNTDPDELIDEMVIRNADYDEEMRNADCGKAPPQGAAFGRLLPSFFRAT